MTQPMLPADAAKDALCGINPVVKTVKKLGRSGLFLAVCLFQTFGVLASLGHAVFMALEGLSVTETFWDFIGFFSSELGFSFVYQGLLALCFWLIRKGCKSNASPFTPTGGLTFLKVLVTLKLVVFYIVAVACPVVFAVAVFSLLFGVGTGEEYLDEFSQPIIQWDWLLDEEFPMGIFLILLVVVFFSAVFHIVVFHCHRRGIKTVSENFGGILSDRSVPVFSVISLIIIAVSGLGRFGGIVPIYMLGSVQQVLNGTALVLLAVTLIKYRGEMKHLRQTAFEEVPSVQPGVFCGQCGAPGKPEVCFCGNCGKPFQNSQQTPVSTQQNC